MSNGKGGGAAAVAGYNLALWDTPGLPKFHQLVSLYYRAAEAAVVVYDITNPQSFQRVRDCAAARVPACSHRRQSTGRGQAECC